MKHAGAAKAIVTIRYVNSAIELEIGQEFRGKGIMGMRERVSLHEGRFEASNIPDGGFSVKVTLPVNGQMS